MALNRLQFAGLHIEWDPGELPLDPFAPVMPLPLEEGLKPEFGDADLSMGGAMVKDPIENPAAAGAVPLLFHGTTRCFQTDEGLVLWNGASALRVSPDGRRIHADVHASSLERPFHFSSITVLMSVLLALRSHGLFHLHAGGARFDDGDTWLIPGESGSGKSTFSMALFVAGARWLSDDALLLRSSEEGVEAVGWARMVRMTARTSNAFPSLGPMLERCPQGSARAWQVDPRTAFVGRGLLSCKPPHRLVFPRVGDGEASTVQPLDRAEAFGRTLHSCEWVGAEQVARRQEQLDLLARLVEHAPAHEVVLGSRLLEDPEAEVAEIRRQLR